MYRHYRKRTGLKSRCRQGVELRSYPFPDKESSREELKRDLLYEKIEKEHENDISDRAWETGAAAALSIMQAYPDKSIADIALEEGLKVKYADKDFIAGKVRYFSEYYSGRKEIIMYTEAIEKWAKSNKVKKEEAYELILAHEFFHHLECTKLGLTSKQHLVPRIRIGKFSFGSAGIRALSEIGAHGFSYTFYKERNILKEDDKKPIPSLSNHAMNDMVFAGHQKAEKIFVDNPVMRFLTGKRKE